MWLAEVLGHTMRGEDIQLCSATNAWQCDPHTEVCCFTLIFLLTLVIDTHLNL